MTNFAAKEKAEFQELPAKRPDYPTLEPLPKVSDGTAVNHYYLRDRNATVTDVCAPGFFNFMRETFRSGAQKGVVHMVTCHLGKVEEGLTSIDLHVVDAPASFGGNVVMADSGPKKFHCRTTWPKAK